jgi:hypothetical protein
LDIKCLISLTPNKKEKDKVKLKRKTKKKKKKKKVTNMRERSIPLESDWVTISLEGVFGHRHKLRGGFPP